MIAWLVVFTVLGYILASLFTACHLNDDRGMGGGQSLLGGIFWPFVTYRAIQNGWITDFLKKLDEATTRN